MDKNAERRVSIRKQVLQTFHVFIVLPKTGLRKIYLKDLSESGMGFFTDATDSFRSGDTHECLFYLNPSLNLPLTIKIAHASPQFVGCEIEKSSKGIKAYQTFLKLLDELSGFLPTED